MMKPAKLNNTVVFTIVFFISICGVCFADPLTITGPDAPSDGSQYSATGGSAPYYWCITKGSITHNGVVTVSGQCGSATITVWDSSGETARKTIRMAGTSRWVQTDYKTCPSFTCAGSGCPCTGGCSWVWGCIFSSYYPVEISGNIKKVGSAWTCASSNGRGCLVWTGPPPPGVSCSGSQLQLVSSITTYEWKCQDGTNGPESSCSSPPVPLKKPKDLGAGTANATCTESAANLKSGNYYHSQSIVARPESLSLDLSYNSLETGDTPLGRGWTHSFNLSLATTSSGLRVKLADGDFLDFVLSGTTYLPASTSTDTSNIVKTTEGSYVRTFRDGLTQTFNASGQLTAISDANGNTTTLAYSGNDLATVTDSTSRNLTIGSSDGRIIAIQDPAGRMTSFAYSGNLLTSVTDPAGTSWRFVYDEYGRMIRKTDPGNNTSENGYDAAGRNISSTDAEGRTKTISYNATGSSSVTEKDGSVWTHAYDPTLNVPTATTDPLGNTVRRSYDAKGNLLSITDPDGNTTRYTYDAANNPLTVTDPLGNTTSYTYDSLGRVLTITDPDGRITINSYDERGNLLRSVDPTGGAYLFAYDAAGNLTSVTDPRGNRVGYVYDTYNTIAAITDQNGKTIRFSHDISGNLLTMKDPDGKITTYSYDALNRLVAITDPLGTTTKFTYDNLGNRTAVTDGNGNLTSYTYNFRNKPLTIRDALGSTTTLAYGGCGSCGGGGNDKLTSLTDANNNLTGYEYDQLGRLARETDPLGNVTGYGYDSRDNLTARTDANGSTATYAYDANNRLLRKTYPDGSVESFSYDARGNILTAANKHISYAFSYDANNRMLSSTGSNNGTLKYEYDPAGNRTTMVTPEGERISYRYDAANHLTAIVSPRGTFDITYNDLGRRTKLSYPNGATISYRYDNSERLVKLEHKTRHGRTIDSFSYTLDRVGNRLSTTEANATTNYGYDAIYRLLYAQQSRRHNSRDNEQYSYDPVGNRLIGPHQQTGYSYGTGNQLLKNDQASFTYDKNGNLAERSLDNDQHGHHGHQSTSWKYTFDYENRLVKAENGAVNVSFAYDPFGRRIEKRTEITGPGERGHDVEEGITRYLYDGMNLIRETRERHRHAGRSETISYLHGPNIDEPLAAMSDHRSWYYHADGLGSIVALTDRHGTVVQEYNYDSFGNPDQRGENIDQPFSYTGREWDRETGLYYYRARYYDPKIGRFIQKDPISFAGGDVNLYAYVLNNPINRLDPFGLWNSKTFPTNISNYANSALYWPGSKYQPIGPFGKICGAEGTVEATWIPDITPEACRKHDECYDKCAKKCAGYDCKKICDSKLFRSNPPYGTATKLYGKDAYDAAKRKYGCNKCN
ncbi:RHS repeat-associated core domain-containing protein [Pelobacter propionicus]|nr:RHS repeat-associated core domain-containing protein [Pelobacter propionicus]